MTKALLSGQQVTFITVTGEKGIGAYSCTKPITGSHLIENVTLEDGTRAAYVWASEILDEYMHYCSQCQTLFDEQYTVYQDSFGGYLCTGCDNKYGDKAPAFGSRLHHVETNDNKTESTVLDAILGTLK